MFGHRVCCAGWFFHTVNLVKLVYVYYMWLFYFIFLVSLFLCAHVYCVCRSGIFLSEQIDDDCVVRGQVSSVLRFLHAFALER